MAKFRTNFWELLSGKEKETGSRYNNMTEIAQTIGISRVTLYKYADNELPSVDAETVDAFMQFLGLAPDDLHKFLYIADNPQSDAQEGKGEEALEAIVA